MDWQTALIPPDVPVLAALSAIHAGGKQLAMVVDADRHLLGIVTDGDVRAHILNGLDLNAPVSVVMNPTPMVATADEDRQKLLAVMRSRRVHQIPLVTVDRRVVGLVTLDDLLQIETHPNLVVLMAGGFGTRLRPLTEHLPKPMLKVGRRPVLETIIGQFQEYGFSRFVISVHYKADVIKSFFGDGRALGAEITYIEEVEPLGTAGALTLLPFRPVQPFFVMNGDLLTKLNFSSLLAFHQENRAPLTMCVREHKLSVPYGVAEIDGNHLAQLVEKPTYRKLVNAGIYVCNPDVIDHLPQGRAVTMVDLAHSLLAQHRPPTVFPIHEYWVDIGQHTDLQQAEADYLSVFG